MILRISVAAVLAGSFTLSAAPASASEILEEIQVTARRQASSTYDVSNAVTVVQNDQSNAPRVLPDLLRGQPGVFVQQTTAGQGAVIVRGLKGSEILHLVDGMRLNTAFFRNAPTQYLALVDAHSTQQLEVVRGPLPALYGSDAMGGVVQVVTRVPQFDSSEMDWRGRASIDYSSAESVRGAHVAVEGGTDRVAGSLGLTYTDIGDRRTPRGTLTPTGYLQRGANAKLVFTPDDTHELMFNLQYMEQPSTPRYDELVAGFDQTEPDSEVFNFEPNDRLFAHIRYRNDAPVGFIQSWQANLAYQQINDDRRTRNFGSRSERRERNASDLFGLTLQASSQAGDDHLLTWGMEFYADEISSSRLNTDLDTGEVSASTPRFPDGSSMDSLALYISDEWALGERLTLNYGGRYSRFDIGLPPGLPSDGLELDDVTGDIGLRFQLSESLQLVSNLGRGFRPPNIFDLGTLGERPGNRFNIPNADLEAESVITLDAGVKFRSDSWSLEALLFYSDYQDKLTSVETGDVTDDGRQIVQTQNVAELRIYGTELGLRTLVGESTEVYANINWLWGEESSGDAPDAPADRIPPLNGRLGLRYEPGDAWWADVYTRFAAEQNRLSDRDVGDNRIDPNGTPGWLTVGMRLGWDLAPGWVVTMHLDNVLDQAYREHGSGLDAPGFDAGISIEARFD